MDGAHLGGDDGIAVLEHLLSELGAVVGAGPGLRLDVLPGTHLHGGQQTADTDAYSAQVVDLVDLQDGVELVAALQDLADLVGGDGVQAAAEGIQLDQLQVVPLADELGGIVQPGVVDPLVQHPQRAAGIFDEGQAVLGEDGQAVGGDELRDAVVDLRVDMVGTARQDDAGLALRFHLRQHFRSLGTDVRLGLSLLRPGFRGGGPDFGFRDVPGFGTAADHAVGGGLLAGEGHEGPDVADVAFRDGFHVVFQIFRVADHDGAVVVVLGGFHFLMLEHDAGMEDGFDALVHQPLNGAVGQFGGVALGFGGDGLHAQLVELAAGEGRKDNFEAQFLEESGPVWVIFVHIQHPGDADDAAGGIFQGRIVEHALSLEFHHILAPGFTLLRALALLAAVAGDVAAAIGELVHGQHAVVGAAAAVDGGGGVGQVQDVVQGQHGGLLAGIALPGDEGRAEGAHDAGNIGAGGFHPGDLFEGPQDGLVVEGAALDHNVAAQVGGVGQFNDLVEGVLDDGVGQARGNVADLGALLLGLLDIGVHEHGAAGTQVHGIFSEQGLLGKAGGGEAQGAREILDEGAAAGGAGFVQQHRIHGAVSQLDALHVLTADVQHAVHLRVKEGGGGTVGHGLHLALLQGEGGFQQGLAVAGGAGSDNADAGGQLFLQPGHGLHGGLDGVALIVGIEGEQQLAFGADEGHLGGGGAGVYPQEAVAPVVFQGLAFNNRLAMAGAEVPVLLLIGKEGRQAVQLEIHLHALVQPLQQGRKFYALPRFRLQGRAHGGKEVGIVGIHGGLRGQLQGTDEGLLQLRQEVEGAAQEGHAAPDGLAAGQARDGLVHHGLENGGGQVRLGGALVDQGLDVGLGKDAAAGGDGINDFVFSGGFIEARGVGLQQRRHLVDEGAGAAGADAVHAFLQAALEIDDLGILAAQLDGHVGLGRHMVQGGGYGHHLLDEADVQGLAQIDGAGAGDGHVQGTRADLLRGFPQQLGQGLLGVGHMAAVPAENDFLVLVQDDQLHGGGADVDACSVSLVHDEPPGGDANGVFFLL